MCIRDSVSPVAGTTRDAIDTTVKRNGQEYIFIDTAGLRRKSKIKEELERYSIIRTVTAVERCDVAVLIIDATEGITEQDAKIAGIAHERGKGMICLLYTSKIGASIYTCPVFPYRFPGNR